MHLLKVGANGRGQVGERELLWKTEGDEEMHMRWDDTTRLMGWEDGEATRVC